MKTLLNCLLAIPIGCALQPLYAEHPANFWTVVLLYCATTVINRLIPECQPPITQPSPE